MPKLKPEVQYARRERLLDAAATCFSRTGFHRTTIDDICKAAGVSPGALYVYFDSKEALIAGMAERDRAEFAERFAALASASDFLEALRTLGEQYFIEEPVEADRKCIDIGLESTRNPRVREIFQRFDGFVIDSFEKLFQRLQDEGRIAPAFDIATTAKAFIVVSDGMFWRRAVDPAFDPKAVMPAVLVLIRALLNPVLVPAQAPDSHNDNNNQSAQ
jgi:AcrR family transcriptional regulator